MSDPIEVAGPSAEEMAEAIAGAQIKQQRLDSYASHPAVVAAERAAEQAEQLAIKAAQEKASANPGVPNVAPIPTVTMPSHRPSRDIQLDSPPEAQHSGPLAMAQFIGEDEYSHQSWADTRPSQVDRGQQMFVFSGVLALGLVVAIALGNGRWRGLGGWAMKTVRQRAAATICAGFALVAVDWLVWKQIDTDRFWDGMHDAGWISLFGALLALVGIYHWIAGPPGDKI